MLRCSRIFSGALLQSLCRGVGGAAFSLLHWNIAACSRATSFLRSLRRGMLTLAGRTPLTMIMREDTIFYAGDSPDATRKDRIFHLALDISYGPSPYSSLPIRPPTTLSVPSPLHSSPPPTNSPPYAELTEAPRTRSTPFICVNPKPNMMYNNVLSLVAILPHGYQAFWIWDLRSEPTVVMLKRSEQKSCNAQHFRSPELKAREIEDREPVSGASSCI